MEDDSTRARRDAITPIGHPAYYILETNDVSDGTEVVALKADTILVRALNLMLEKAAEGKSELFGSLPANHTSKQLMDLMGSPEWEERVKGYEDRFKEFTARLERERVVIPPGVEVHKGSIFEKLPTAEDTQESRDEASPIAKPVYYVMEASETDEGTKIEVAKTDTNTVERLNRELKEAADGRSELYTAALNQADYDRAELFATISAENSVNPTPENEELLRKLAKPPESLIPEQLGELTASDEWEKKVGKHEAAFRKSTDLLEKETYILPSGVDIKKGEVLEELPEGVMDKDGVILAPPPVGKRKLRQR